MSAMLILIACSLLIAGSFLAAFIWSIQDDQYEDDYTPSIRMLLDDKEEKPKELFNPSNNKQ
ncbi:MAG: cbb3-type cytochrome oxidase assembly protein CcoS [Bacteroidetes bacterium]|nr:cbb3-type cytochrome oxidase assembly protein CcoS [Bacteroidota bacterium]